MPATATMTCEQFRHVEGVADWLMRRRDPARAKRSATTADQAAADAELQSAKMKGGGRQDT